MFDLHSHILYNIDGDDGSRSEAMSLAMLRQAAAAGTTDLFATPHFHRRGICPNWDLITERLVQLQQQADAAQIPIRLHSGAEVSLDADTLNYLPGPGEHRDCCLAGTAYLLVELLPTAAPLETWNLLYQLQLRGYLPILAHPERYKAIMAQPQVVRQWVEKGILLQSNQGSFTGDFGESALRSVRWLYDRGLIHFLGSDAHRTDWRSPDTRKAQEAIRSLIGGDAFLADCDAPARLLLQGRVFYPDPPHEPLKKKRSFWSRFFG